MIQIHSCDANWTKIDRQGYLAINDFLSYEKVFWLSTFGRKQRKTYQKHLVNRIDGNYIFHTGLVPKVIQYLKRNGYTYSLSSEVPTVSYDDPKLKGIVFRDYQEEIIYSAIEQGRGVLLAVTGSGKTICIGGILSAFSLENSLVLVHSVSIATQIFKSLENWGFSPKMIDTKNPRKSRIMVSTIQSFKRVVENYTEWFDVVIVDEAHHIKSIESKNYGFALQRITAPCRFGFTATLSTEKSEQLALEALIGQVIFNYDNDQATEDKILAVPSIKIYETESIPEVVKLKDYQMQYKFGISKNQQRNKLIVSITKEHIEENKTLLILVKQLEHGENLQNEFSRQGYEVPFVQGSSEKNYREEVKTGLKNGRIKYCISSDIWIEGLDIPNLQVLINASAGKSDLVSIQKCGRVLRLTDTKDKATIIDFIDYGKYLTKHSNRRIKLYQSRGWKIEFINNY